MPGDLFGRFADAHIDIAAPGRADRAAGVLVHHKPAEVAGGARFIRRDRHRQKRRHGAGIDVLSGVVLLVHRDRRLGRNRNAQRAIRAAHRLFKEHKPVVLPKVFVHHRGVLLEIFLYTPGRMLFAREHAICFHGVGRRGIFIAVETVPANFDQLAVGHLQFRGALDGDHVSFPTALDEAEFLTGQDILAFDLLPRVIRRQPRRCLAATRFVGAGVHHQVGGAFV